MNVVPASNLQLQRTVIRLLGLDADETATALALGANMAAGARREAP
jgi:hypothetical protein